MDTKRLREMRDGAIKTHPICLNDPDYGEGGDPDASYCHLCWEQGKDKQAFLAAAADALPALLEEREKLIGALRELVADLRQKALFNESQRTYNALEWKAVAFEQARIAEVLTAALGKGRQVG